jgi:hypothetical protein
MTEYEQKSLETLNRIRKSTGMIETIMIGYVLLTGLGLTMCLFAAARVF